MTPRRVRLLVALSLLTVLALVAPAASAAPPASQPENFVFLIYDRSGTPIAVTVTEETFHGNSDVATGTWVTYAYPYVPSGSNTVIATGRLAARHLEAGVVASVVQSSPRRGHGTLTVDFTPLPALPGNGLLEYTAQGGLQGTTRFLVTPLGLNTNTYRVDLLDEVPPVLFTSPR